MGNKKETFDYINEVMEHVIERTKLAPFDPTKKAIDFRLDDIVKCSYIPGLFKVVDCYPNGLLICPIDNSNECEFVRAGFLEKQVIDKNTMKVLYD